MSLLHLPLQPGQHVRQHAAPSSSNKMRIGTSSKLTSTCHVFGSALAIPGGEEFSRTSRCHAAASQTQQQLAIAPPHRHHGGVGAALEQLRHARRIILHPRHATPPSPASDARRRRDWLHHTQQSMLKFMGPAVLIPLGDPLMALMDTLFVGQFAGTLELAAMGPANMLISFVLYTSRALPVALMGLMAAQLQHTDTQQQPGSSSTSGTIGTARPGAAKAEPDAQRQQATDAATSSEHSQGRDAASRFLGGGLLMALALGGVGACVLGAGSEALVAWTGVRDTALLGPAAEYLRIRAWALPAVLLTMVAQSGKLAQQDSLTPCLSVLVMVAASLLANVGLVGVMGLGLKGAALSTVAVQYLGAGVLLALVFKGGEGEGNNTSGSNNNVKPSWGMRPQELRALLAHMAPLSLVFTAKNLAYLCVSATAALLPTAAMAAHNATYSLWVLFTWALSPVEQACLAFLPTATRRWQQRALALHVLKLGAGVAVAAGAALAGLLLLGPGLVVKDALVQPMMSLVAAQAALALSLAGADMGATAVNISLGDSSYVASSYLVTLAGTAAYFSLCRHQGWGLTGVWWGLVVFFGVRAAQSVGRVAVTLGLPAVGPAGLPAGVLPGQDVAAVSAVGVVEAANKLKGAAESSGIVAAQQEQQQVDGAESSGIVAAQQQLDGAESGTAAQQQVAAEGGSTVAAQQQQEQQQEEQHAAPVLGNSNRDAQWSQEAGEGLVAAQQQHEPQQELQHAASIPTSSAQDAQWSQEAGEGLVAAQQQHEPQQELQHAASIPTSSAQDAQWSQEAGAAELQRLRRQQEIRLLAGGGREQGRSSPQQANEPKQQGQQQQQEPQAQRVAVKEHQHVSA